MHKADAANKNKADVVEVATNMPERQQRLQNEPLSSETETGL